MRPRFALALGPLVALVPLAGCPLLEIEADVPEICLTYPNLRVDAPAAAGALHQQFTFADLSAVQDLASHDASVRFVRAQLRLTSGPTDLSFLQAARLVVASGDPATTLPPLTMYDCAGDCAPAGDIIDIPAASDGDAIDYLRSGSIVVDLELAGAIPAGTWTMDVDVCMAAHAGYAVQP